jgi:hypothetical protein
MSVSHARHDREEMRFFGRSQRIPWLAPWPAPSVIPARLISPALHRSGRDPKDATRRVEPGARRLGLGQGREHHRSLSSSVLSASPSQSRFTFF